MRDWRKSRVQTVAAVFLAVSGAARAPAGPSDIGDIGWVGLFNRDLVTWLENENQLQHLCGSAASQSAEGRRCRAEKMAPKTLVVRLFKGPSDNAPSAGALRIVAMPGAGLRAFFVRAEGGTPMEFKPDLFDNDWGYGPYFHETYLERRGTWFQLPKGPFPSGTWFDASSFGTEPEVKLLEAGEIVSSPSRDLFVVGIEPGVLRARLEQPADMWCGDGDPPPLKRFKELRIPYTRLYSATGHLLIHVKYTRGC